MIAIDVGNTSTAIGLWVKGKVTNIFHCVGSFEEATKIVDRLSARSTSIAYASVVPKMDAKWRAFAKKRGYDFRQITYRDVKLKLDFENPESIGADRLADAAGAVARYGAPVIVLDFGTAFTAAVITKDEVWRGGVIAPGLPLMIDYLHERTAKLPKLVLAKASQPRIGRTTEEAMRFGMMVGYRGMVCEIVKQLKGNFKENFRIVVTGGYAKYAMRNIDFPFTADPTLTLFGTGLLGTAGETTWEGLDAVLDAEIPGTEDEGE